MPAQLPVEATEQFGNLLYPYITDMVSACPKLLFVIGIVNFLLVQISATSLDQYLPKLFVKHIHLVIAELLDRPALR